MSDEYSELSVPPEHDQKLVIQSQESPPPPQSNMLFQKLVRNIALTPYPPDQSDEECSKRKEENCETPQDNVICFLTYSPYYPISLGYLLDSGILP